MAIYCPLEGAPRLIGTNGAIVPVAQWLVERYPDVGRCLLELVEQQRGEAGA
jgi:hypothetical protein